MKRAHLSDDRLIEICLAARQTSIDEPHLRDCRRCQSRRATLASTLTDVSMRVMSEADEAFPAARLARQHARIMQQVEQIGRPARVIAFPAGHRQEPVRPVVRHVRRWIAATGAVAVAFLVGVFSEHLAHQFPTAGRPDSRLSARVSDSAMARNVVARNVTRTVAASMSDDELLGQIEAAGGMTGPAVLRSLDALTPRAWDVPQ
jgi:hypothetical protein